MRRWMWLMVLAVVLAPAVSAQAGNRITGTVTSTGEASNPISGAILTVLGTNRRAVTDASGRFTITDVPAGTQQVRADPSRRHGQPPAAIASSRKFVFSRIRPER